MLLELEFGLPMLLFVNGTPAEEGKTPCPVVHPIKSTVLVRPLAAEVLEDWLNR